MEAATVRYSLDVMRLAAPVYALLPTPSKTVDKEIKLSTYGC